MLRAASPTGDYRPPCSLSLVGSVGTQGVNQMVEDYAKPTGFTLHCVGTWHSHLQDSGGSPRDYQTAALIAAKIAIPSILLIKTPSGYPAILAKVD